MNTCPACQKPRRGRYCNDAHPMRRTRPMTEEEWAEWLREHSRAYLRRQRPAAETRALAAAMVLGF